MLGTEIAAHADPEKAFVPIAMLGPGRTPTVTPKLPVNSVKELIALAKAQPGKLNYASAGVGTFQHLGSELFRIMPNEYRSRRSRAVVARLADVIAGNTEMCLGSLLQVIPHIDSKRLKLLGIGSVKRTKVYPNVPTIAEAGVLDTMPVTGGASHRVRTPPAIVTRLRNEVAAILATADIQKKFEGQGAETVTITPDEFGKLIKTEMVK